MLTLLRFAAHIVVGILMGLLYWRVGNDAAVIYNNAGLLFFSQLFILFTAMMPTVVTCKQIMTSLTIHSFVNNQSITHTIYSSARKEGARP